MLADDKFFDFNMQHAKGAKMPRGNKEEILKYQIPVPPPDEQARIVAILDKFDALTNSVKLDCARSNTSITAICY